LGVLKLIWLAGVAFLLSGLGGCGGSAERLAPVVGKVTVGGAPLTTGSVSFHPHAEKGNSTQHLPVGMIDSQGNYKLVTATQEGAPLGWYRVTVSAQAPIDQQNPYAMPKHLVNPKYGDPNTSGLEVEVTRDAAALAYDLRLAK
jgi:hypothetical protein